MLYGIGIFTFCPFSPSLSWFTIHLGQVSVFGGQMFPPINREHALSPLSRAVIHTNDQCIREIICQQPRASLRTCSWCFCVEKSVDCPCCACSDSRPYRHNICPDRAMSKSISSSCTSVLEREREKKLTVHVVHAVIRAIIDIICPDRARSKSINSWGTSLLEKRKKKRLIVHG